MAWQKTIVHICNKSETSLAQGGFLSYGRQKWNNMKKFEPYPGYNDMKGGAYCAACDHPFEADVPQWQTENGDLACSIRCAEWLESESQVYCGEGEP